MLTFRPFCALHYDAAAVGDLAAVIAPPYDVIDNAQLERLYARSPHNVVRLILNRDADRYASAAAAFAEWRARGVLVSDAQPCLYYYVQDFTVPGGGRRQRAGFMAAVRLEDFSSGVIRPHERTFPRAKEDRLRLVTACRANLSPIFGIYPERTGALEPARAQSAAEAPWIDVSDEGGDRHRVWRLADPAVIGRIQSALADTTVFIADGHHRYETSLAYRDQRRAAGETDPEAPYNYVLMFLTSMDEPGLVVLPTHRLWHGPLPGGPAGLGEKLAVHFDIEEVSGGAGALFARLNAETALGCLGVCAGDRQALLRLRDPRSLKTALAGMHPAVRALDVSVLDAFVLREMLGIDCSRAAQDGLLTYTHDDAQAVAAVAGGASAAFLLRMPRMREVEAVCMSGQVMPEKSTYFYPKLQSGLVLHLLDAVPAAGPRA